MTDESGRRVENLSDLFQDIADGETPYKFSPNDLADAVAAYLARPDVMHRGRHALLNAPPYATRHTDAGRAEHWKAAVSAMVTARRWEPPVALADGRSPTCIEAWPDCEDGAYDPRCCRFPKSCSCWVADR